MTAFSRPKTLVEVQHLGSLHGKTDPFLREFMDEFYTTQDSERRAAMIRDEPALSENEKINAYLGAVAEYLAHNYKLPVPAWTEAPSRFLQCAYFPCGLKSLEAILIEESPEAFRRRMIFVDADPLYRPRKDHPEFGR